MQKKLLRVLIMFTKYSLLGMSLQCLLLTFVLASESHAQKYQSVRQVYIQMELEDASLRETFQQLESITNFRFSFNREDIDLKLRINVTDTKQSVADLLYRISGLANLKFKQINNNITVIKLPTIDRNKTSPIEIIIEEIDIHGKVTDEKGLPLPGVNILVKGTTNGTITDIDGNYKLSVPSNGSLLFSFIGYVKEEIKVNNRNTINLQLSPNVTSLNEILVVGYGTVEKEDLTGAVSSVKAAEIENISPTINIDEVLQGKVSGVYIVQETGQPGSAARVRIRGTTSLLGSNQPLYVIDGIPVIAQSNIPNTGDAFDTDLSQEGLNTPLGNINPADIESVNILKDASAAAIYGSRAANGVIIITTKRGTFSGKPQFNAGYSLSTQMAKTTDVLNAAQFREIYTEAVNNSTSTTAFANQVRDGSYFGDANTNWEEEVSHDNPITQNFDFSLRGGNTRTKYYASMGIQGQKGVFNNSSFNRKTLNLNLDTELSEKLIFGTNLNISGTLQESPDGSLLDRIYEFRPDLPVFNEDGNYSISPFFNLENPVALSTAGSTNETFLFLGSVFADLEIIEGINLKSSVSVNLNNGNLKSYYPSVTFTGGFSRTGGPGDGFARQSSSRALSHLWENTLNFHLPLANNNDINAVIGASWQGDRSQFLQASGKGFPKDKILTNLSSASKDFKIASNEVQSGLVSYFGRMNYNYNDRYLITVSGRIDGSSKFAKDNKYAVFPTIAGAWRISNEPFMSDVTFIDELKLRASTGVTGQQSFGPYQWRTLYESTFYADEPAVVRSQMGNSKLKWETTNQLDFGLNFSILKNRLSGGIGYYEKNTNDLLYFLKVPGNTGISQVIANLGDTENHGIEIELTADIIHTNDFTWNLSANFTRNRNKLVKLNDDFLEENGTIKPPNTGSILKIGEPIGLIYGYVAEGIFQNQNEIDALNGASETGNYQNAQTAPGDLKFQDIDGDGTITSADQTIIGNTQADYFGGFTNTLSYKGFSLSALFTYSVGNDMRWDAQRNGINVASTYLSENKTIDILNRWTADNPTGQPRVIYTDPNNNDRISSFYVHDASFIRLKNINLSYTFSSTQHHSIKLLKAVSVYVSATNLLTFTNYPGADPETNNLFDNDVSAGLDNSRYPTPKVYTTGIRVSF